MEVSGELHFFFNSHPVVYVYNYYLNWDGSGELHA